MPEFTIHLDDPQDTIANLRQAGGIGLADQIERQLPKAPVEEPTGDVVIAASSGWFFEPGGDLGWVRDDLKPYTWEGVLDFGDPVVYRREPATPPAEAADQPLNVYRPGPRSAANDEPDNSGDWYCAKCAPKEPTS